jgi:hypothetical protein
MKEMWYEEKTHSTIDDVHNHFPRTGLYVVFHVKHDVLFSVVVDCVNHLLSPFVISPGSFSNNRSSDLVLSALEGNTRLLFVFLQDSITTVLVILVVLSNFVHLIHQYRLHVVFLEGWPSMDSQQYILVVISVPISK